MPGGVLRTTRALHGQIAGRIRPDVADRGALPPASTQPEGSGLMWADRVSRLWSQLETGAVRNAPRRPPAPGGQMPPAERHELAIRQSLRWAERAAREGDYERALGWLTMVERVEGRLPDEWRRTREVWRAAWATQRAHGRRPGSH
jgi:hypothetical protein